MELDDEDDEHQGPLLPPDDRLWRHPSEIAAHGLPDGRGPRATRASTGRGAPLAALRTHVPWSSFLSGVVGALLVIGMVTAVGGFRTREVPTRSEERVAVSSYEAALPEVRVADAVPMIVDQLRPALVQVRGERPEGELRSSGIVLRSDGYIVTSHRVISGATRVWVTLSDATRYLATIVGSDPNTAIGVLKIERDDLAGAALGLGRSASVKPGQTAIAVASPPWVGVGVVAAVGREVRSKDSPLLVDMIEVDARLDPLASGGPLVDAQGAVIGVTDVHGDRGYATPIDIVSKVADELIRTGQVVYPWLGVEGEDIDTELAAKLAIDGGALVTDVAPESPAYMAGVHPGDVITDLENVRIRSMGSLKVELRNRRPGEAVTLRLVRDGRPMTLNVTLVFFPNRL